MIQEIFSHKEDIRPMFYFGYNQLQKQLWDTLMYTK